MFVDVTADIVIPKHYIVTKTSEQIIIDRIANESSWQSALFSDSFIDIEGTKTPKFDTKIKMLWDENYLYVYAEMEEPHIWGNLTERDAIIYLNNDFEIFIDPSGRGINYGEIEINALGTVWDLHLDKAYRVGGKANTHWNLNEIKSAVHIKGTLNDPGDIDTLWSVEIAIPIKPLIEFKNKSRFMPVDGEQWRINFSRVQWEHEIINGTYQRKREEGKLLDENNWVWSMQKVINMHEPEKWGILQFSDDSTSENVIFVEDRDMLIKQSAYALFRLTRFGSLKKLLQNDICFTQDIEVKYSEKESLVATFFKTNMGFEFKLKSPLTGKIYIINEEGVLKAIK